MSAPVWTILLLCAQTPESASEPADGQAFLQRMEAAFAPINDLRFEFVGTIRDHESLEIDMRCVGTYRFSGAEERVDYRIERGPQSTAVSDARHTVSHAVQGDRQVVVARAAVAPNPQGVITPSSKKLAASALNAPGLPGRILFLNCFRGYEAEIRESFRSHASEQVDGRRCLKISFDQFPGLPEEQSVRHTFWLDPIRGYQPIQWEHSIGDRLRIKVADVELVQFDGANGTDVWLPVAGTVTTYPAALSEAARRRGIKRRTFVEDIAIDASTVQLNRGTQDTPLAIKLEGGSYVDDQVTKSKYVVRGSTDSNVQLAGLTPEQAAGVMDETIASANKQAMGLRADSRARTWWRSWATWVATLSALAGAVLVLWYLSKRGAP